MRDGGDDDAAYDVYDDVPAQLRPEYLTFVNLRPTAAQNRCLCTTWQIQNSRADISFDKPPMADHNPGIWKKFWGIKEGISTLVQGFCEEWRNVSPEKMFAIGNQAPY